jgi:hypothetical protein
VRQRAMGRRFPAIGRLVLVALPLVVGAFVAFGAHPARAQDEVPFLGSWDGQLNVTGQSGGAVEVTGAAYGSASFLSDSTLIMDQVIDLTTNPATLSGGNFTIFGAASGTLLGEYVGQIGAPDASGNAAIAGTYTIDGGYGPFDNATGSGTIAGTVNVATGALSVQMSGTVSPPGPVTG